jgi:hypothetical protein
MPFDLFDEGSLPQALKIDVVHPNRPECPSMLAYMRLCAYF